MFSGIIRAMGRVREATLDAGGVRLTLEVPGILGTPREGDSIAVNGVCLTVTQAEPGIAVFDAVWHHPRTAPCWDAGPREGRVNLEPSLAHGRFRGRPLGDRPRGRGG